MEDGWKSRSTREHTEEYLSRKTAAIPRSSFCKSFVVVATGPAVVLLAEEAQHHEHAVAVVRLLPRGPLRVEQERRAPVPARRQVRQRVRVPARRRQDPARERGVRVVLLS